MKTKASKKRLCTVLAILLLLNVLTVSALAAETEIEDSSLYSLPFTDAQAGDWFYASVQYVFEHDIMVGTSATTFSPHTNLTRAMLATILYRMEGEPPVVFRSAFSDVTAGRWYSAAVTWAYDVGIVQGVGGGRFAPDELLTKEQLAAMMYRYAQDRGYNLSVPAYVTAPAGTSNWAREYMRWAEYYDFIATANPSTAASRADTAYFVHRFSVSSPIMSPAEAPSDSIA